MSRALAVVHGRFGRASLYLLNRPLATHAHREGHLLFHVGGRCSAMTVGDIRCDIDPGAAAAVNPWQPHSFAPGDEDEGTLFLLLYVNPAWFLEAACGAGGALRFGRRQVEVTGRIARLVRRVTAMMLDTQRSDLFDGYLYELTHLSFEQTSQGAANNGPACSAGVPLRDYRVRNSIRLMEQRLGDELELDGIARDAGLSRPHFYKLFRRHVGLTPNIYVNTLRMETAIERLTRSEDAVTAIGLDLGFASQASFTRFFTSNVGIPPTDYRRVALLAA